MHNTTRIGVRTAAEPTCQIEWLDEGQAYSWAKIESKSLALPNSTTDRFRLVMYDMYPKLEYIPRGQTENNAES